jgi:23S rRNA pseudouridine1911/1915/1917 synthase
MAQLEEDREDDEPEDELDAFADDEPAFEPPLPSGPRPVHLDADGRPRIIERRLEVHRDFTGWRLDLYLKRRIPRLSRTRIQTIIATQLEGPDGRRMKSHSPVQEGDVLTLRRPARSEPPCPRDFDVLCDEPSFMVVDKPANLPVHASARYYFGTLTRLLAERFPGQPLQIAHRLDRETSGCLVVARGRDAASTIKGAFATRRVQKVYQALVHGIPAWDGEQLIDLPLALASGTKSKITVRMEPAPGRPGALSAQTRVRVLEVHRGCALVECRPITGRQHQIRAHLAALGFPIVGDKLYGHGDEAFADYCNNMDSLTEAAVEARFGMARQGLHAAAVTFPHPDSGTPFTVRSPLAADIVRYIQRTAEVV